MFLSGAGIAQDAPAHEPAASMSAQGDAVAPEPVDVVDETNVQLSSPASLERDENATPIATEARATEATTTPPATESDLDQAPQARPETSEPNTWDRVSEGLRLDLGLTYATFEQQVKSEVGGVSVEPIVEDRSFGLALTATYGIWKYIRLGLFFQLDMGSRFAGRYAGLDANGTPVINGRVGGSYREFWMGPLLRVQWRGIAAEFGYGALGVRSDDARDDLPTAAGETGALRTSPRIAWHAALSGYVPVHPHVDVVFRIQYRVRYYDRRSGGSLAGGVVHGTQNLTPTVGVSWRM